MKKRLIVILFVVTLIAAALSPTAVSAAAKPLTHVVITPASCNLLVGTTQQFTARGEDANNDQIDGLTYTWALVIGGGTIDSNGLFTAATTTGTFANTVQVTARQGTKSVIGVASVTIFAAAGPLDHVVISPTTATLPVSGTRQFTAQGQDANNLPISGLTYVWSVVNGGGSIDITTGLFTAGDNPDTYTDTVKVTATQGALNEVALASITIKAGPNQNKSNFFPWGWLQGSKKGWQGLHFPPGWFKNGKANQADDEIIPASPQRKGNQNNNKNKNK